ncbi:MAG: hypothetical protein M3Z92_00225 [Bacteroidota bacterium]|nr:hypothetical protein [Bacteroidota bacterium]
MPDLIVLYFLTREIGRLAFKKGLKPLTWKIYNIIGWLGAELVGVVIGVLTFGMKNIVSVQLIAFAFAITSYFIIKAQLNKLPDRDIDDDINRIGGN